MMQRLRAYYRQAYPDHAKRFDSLIRQDAAGRHLLIEALVPMMNADRREAILLAPVLLHEDVVWLVKQALKYATDDAHARKFALLAETALRDLADTGTFERIYTACQESSVMAEHPGF
jgi:hypothetical protein